MLKGAVDRLRLQHGHPVVSLHRQFGHLFFGLIQPDVVALEASAVARVRAVHLEVQGFGRAGCSFTHALVRGSLHFPHHLVSYNPPNPLHRSSSSSSARPARSIRRAVPAPRCGHDGSTTRKAASRRSHARQPTSWTRSSTYVAPPRPPAVPHADIKRHWETWGRHQEPAAGGLGDGGLRGSADGGGAGFGKEEGGRRVLNFPMAMKYRAMKLQCSTGAWAPAAVGWVRAIVLLTAPALAASSSHSHARDAVWHPGQGSLCHTRLRAQRHGHRVRRRGRRPARRRPAVN